MISVTLRNVVLILGLLTSAVASANLITNGGFEETDVGKNKWAWFTSDKVNGWQGSNIEIWDNYNRVTAFEGTQHAELNAHSSNGDAFSIFQTFSTQVGGLYDVSFAYSARSNSNEAFMFNLDSADKTQIWSSLIDDHTVGQWSVFRTSFVAKDLETSIRFTSITPYSSTVGNFLDDIVVSQAFSASKISEVSEPLGAIFFGLGLLAVMRNRKAKANHLTR